MNVDALEQMKSRIDQMSKTQHVEILQLLHSIPDVKLNENKSGVYVNLSFLPPCALDKLREYLDYVQYQENCLHMDENQKTEYKKTFFVQG